MEAVKDLEQTTPKEIPGPKGLELIKLGMSFQKDPLYTMEYIHKTWGDIVWCPWPNRKCLFIFHPEDLKHLLKDNQMNYHKSSEYRHMKPLLGEGLLTSEDEKWKSQRKIMAKEFHPARIEEYFPRIKDAIDDTMVVLTSDMDLNSVFSKLTFQIAGDIFFGANVSQFSDDAKEALENETIRMNKRMRRAFNFPFSVPTPENCKGRKSVATLDGIVESIMDNKEESDSFNVLRKLMAQSPALPKNVIRDEVMTLLLAGHETTSNSLTWTFFYLCQHPEWQQELKNELKALGSKASELTVQDIALLKVHRSVVLEAIRLMPPIPAISRMSLAPDSFRGYEIEAGISVTAIPYVTHRDARFWNDPLSFKPERFFDRKDRKDDFTFFPFARGARACIGEELAMVESILILANFIESRTWSLEENFKPEPVHHLTLKSANGLKVKSVID
jgi:cytochrome P450